jgi:hypothetical protein
VSGSYISWWRSSFSKKNLTTALPGFDFAVPFVGFLPISPTLGSDMVKSLSAMWLCAPAAISRRTGSAGDAYHRKRRGGLGLLS